MRVGTTDSSNDNRKGPFKKMSRLKGEGVRRGVTKCDRGGGSVALRDVTPVEFF